jgi:hypothetical protein
MDEIQKYRELDRYFQGVDHVDVKTIEGEVSLRRFVSGMLSYSPWWIVCLYQVREFLVKALGLVKHEKPDILPSVRLEDLSFTSGDQAFLFMVRAAKEDAYWVSETPNDKHLAAFLGVVAEPMSHHMTRFHLFTSVRYLHWTGPVYFNLIRPFHHLVVSSMMRHGIRQPEFHEK